MKTTKFMKRALIIGFISLTTLIFINTGAKQQTRMSYEKTEIFIEMPLEMEDWMVKPWKIN
jgi:hypothetical protein